MAFGSSPTKAIEMAEERVIDVRSRAPAPLAVASSFTSTN
jgi:hypothetical protein